MEWQGVRLLRIDISWFNKPGNSGLDSLLGMCCPWHRLGAVWRTVFVCAYSRTISDLKCVFRVDFNSAFVHTISGYDFGVAVWFIPEVSICPSPGWL